MTWCPEAGQRKPRKSCVFKINECFGQLDLLVACQLALVAVSRGFSSLGCGLSI